MRDIAQIIWNTESGFQYNPQTLDNDFVVLRLSEPLDLNDEVKPACLPSSATYLGVESTEERCFTSGWGTLSAGLFKIIRTILKLEPWHIVNQASEMLRHYRSLEKIYFGQL